MLLNLLRFELRFLFKRPVSHIYFGLAILMAFIFLYSDVPEIVGGVGKVYKNSPYVLSQAAIRLCLALSLIATVIAGTAIIRDFRYRVHELYFTTPISKLSYFGSRLGGALVMMLFVFAGILLGYAASAHLPWWWLEAEKYTGFDPGAYAAILIFIIIPNVIFITAVFFAVGTLTRRIFLVYVQGIAFLVLYNIAVSIVSGLEHELLSALLDPFGRAAYQLDTRYWTVAEKNLMAVPLDGYFILNRLVWLAVSVLVVIGTYFGFSFRAPATSGRSKRAAIAEAPRKTTQSDTLLLPRVQLHSGGIALWQQIFSETRFTLNGILRSIPFLAIVVIGLVFYSITALNADRIFGATVFPVTYIMNEASDAFNIFLLILITFYAGELVWRERQLGIDQAVDALPTSTFVGLMGKLIALCIAVAVLLGALILGGMFIQSVKGYFNFEIGQYLVSTYLFKFPAIVQLTVLAFLLHVLVNRKLFGHIVVVVFFLVGLVLLPNLDLGHNLYNYAGSPTGRYSDMNGFGHYLEPQAWFTFYWSAAALILLLLTYLFWIRGKVAGLKPRLALARQRSNRSVAILAGLALAAFAGSGAFIYYNTNVLNNYRSNDELSQERVDYERRYKQYEGRAQPKITEVSVNVDIFPAERNYTIRGRYQLVNKQDSSIDSLFVLLTTDLDSCNLHFGRSYELTHDDAEVGFRIYRLKQALLPGDSLSCDFSIVYFTQGFRNSNFNNSIVANGTFINSVQFPHFGYDERFELGDENERKEFDLPPKKRMPSIDDETARQTTYITKDADWVRFEATLSTSPDQIAVAPGYLQREWLDEGRRFFHYRMDAPILHFYSFLSARYDVARDKWRDVAIEIFHHPSHTYNVERMIDATQKSLDYFSANFSPYQHRQVRILEFPRYATFAQSFPNTIPFSERIGFITRVEDEEEDLDTPFYVTAHEVAHQWWAHQVIGANVQGATLLSETLAQYSALMVMKREYGSDLMQRFLRFELDSYLRGRSGERQKELPLMLVENQDYIHYRKGSLIMYALQDYIGEDSVNAALQRYVAATAFQEPPFTTSREFMHYIRGVTPDSLQYLLHDFFETITLYENKTTKAEYKQMDDGRYRVLIDLQSKKLRADSLGNESPIAINDLIDIGIFGDDDEQSELGRPLYLAKHRFQQEQNQIEIVVDEEPQRAGIDPYNKLIDRTPDDNVKTLDEQ